ncbi:MAG: DUF488 domain-containing protein [Ilyomonas sp.]
METNKQHKIIWTIGHSTRSIEDFIALLKQYKIELLVDIRRFPGSKKFPHFNKDALCNSLQKAGINYQHIEALGGRRNINPQSKNTAWHNASFRSYADYMETSDFKNGITFLEQLALQRPTAYMCSEAVWWRCHRSLVSDYLKTRGWQVMHIMDNGKAEEHPYTSVAKVVQGNLFYGNE